MKFLFGIFACVLGTVLPREGSLLESAMNSTLADCVWYNWSMAKCSEEMHDRIIEYTGDTYSCITTDDVYGYDLAVYGFNILIIQDESNKLAAVCGPKSNTDVDKYYFANQCYDCTNFCMYQTDVAECVSKCVKDRGQRFCTNASGRYTFVVTNWNSDVAYYAYGGHLYGSHTLVYCTGYCVDN